MAYILRRGSDPSGALVLMVHPIFNSVVIAVYNVPAPIRTRPSLIVSILHNPVSVQRVLAQHQENGENGFAQRQQTGSLRQIPVSSGRRWIIIPQI